MKIKVIAVIGKSGSGKNSLLQEVLASAPDTFHQIINCTTRPSREKEVEGKDYFFLTGKEFIAKIKNNEMLEYTKFNDWYYGTMKEALSTEKVNIGVFNPAGIRELSKNSNIDLSIVWVHTSDKERLLRQLYREDCPNVDEIIRRFQTDKEDFKNLSNEFFIIHLDNDTYDDLIRNVNSILTTFG